MVAVGVDCSRCTAGKVSIFDDVGVIFKLALTFDTKFLIPSSGFSLRCGGLLCGMGGGGTFGTSSSLLVMY